MKKCLHLHISGSVQGVFFRASTKAKADELGICGIVMNMADGEVYVEAEGDEDTLTLFVNWCKIGPPRAKVDHVEIREGALKYFKKFEVVR